MIHITILLGANITLIVSKDNNVAFVKDYIYTVSDFGQLYYDIESIDNVNAALVVFDPIYAKNECSDAVILDNSDNSEYVGYYSENDYNTIINFLKGLDITEITYSTYGRIIRDLDPETCWLHYTNHGNVIILHDGSDIVLASIFSTQSGEETLGRICEEYEYYQFACVDSIIDDEVIGTVYSYDKLDFDNFEVMNRLTLAALAMQNATDLSDVVFLDTTKSQQKSASKSSPVKKSIPQNAVNDIAVSESIDTEEGTNKAIRKAIMEKSIKEKPIKEKPVKEKPVKGKPTKARKMRDTKEEDYDIKDITTKKNKVSLLVIALTVFFVIVAAALFGYSTYVNYNVKLNNGKIMELSNNIAAVQATISNNTRTSDSAQMASLVQVSDYIKLFDNNYSNLLFANDELVIERYYLDEEDMNSDMQYFENWVSFSEPNSDNDIYSVKYHFDV